MPALNLTNSQPLMSRVYIFYPLCNDIIQEANW